MAIYLTEVRKALIAALRRHYIIPYTFEKVYRTDEFLDLIAKCPSGKNLIRWNRL